MCSFCETIKIFVGDRLLNLFCVKEFSCLKYYNNSNLIFVITEGSFTYTTKPLNLCNGTKYYLNSCPFFYVNDHFCDKYKHTDGVWNQKEK